MRQPIPKRKLIFGSVSVLALLLGVIYTPATAESNERTDVVVEVKDAETGRPISQAHITFQFTEPGSPLKLKRSKMISYSAKTNAQGRYKFTNIPKGTVRVMVIAQGRQTFGKEFEVEQDNQVIEVKLKKPQPLL